MWNFIFLIREHRLFLVSSSIVENILKVNIFCSYFIYLMTFCGLFPNFLPFPPYSINAVFPWSMNDIFIIITSANGSYRWFCWFPIYISLIACYTYFISLNILFENYWKLSNKKLNNKSGRMKFPIRNLLKIINRNCRLTDEKTEPGLIE